ncbi:cytochrome c biogenesis protein [Gloeocapsa sp. PCC 73106]|uniref:cytochrome c biogenesis protein n=1 Tax=Gloeocapsa sp. PCC 73106 TaxID=102232 RepID=UPI0002ACF0BA|nr:cytochrome c biogenesis protein [Gloeocapsa sp. PCC 73106]ELR96717.1 ResB protein required for cytochrome c biosynthesis [Gloeocapsa sp. PCC 73106]
MTLSEAIVKLPRDWGSQLLKTIADLRLAIILFLAIALVSISGTVIEQGESMQFYQQNYPEDPALFGFLTAQVIVKLGLDHVYTTWWFLTLLLLFGSSLIACTFNRQIPALKAARNWKFYHQPRQFQKLALSIELDRGSMEVLSPLLQKQGYRVFQDGEAIYARKGIIGRIGPIVVHVGMIIVLLGAIWGAFTGFLAQEMIASGDTFRVTNIFSAGRFASQNIPTDWSVKVNRFWIDYSDQGEVDQFYSDLSVVDNQGQQIKRETIHVNKPLRYDGVTFYQTNWGIAAVKVQLNNSPIFRLPMVDLPGVSQGRLWGTWIPTKPDLSEGVSLIARDLQGTLLVYGVDGQLINAIRPGMGLEINGVTLKVIELIGSTGLQIKADPGVPLVYTGFALLMAGVVMSYVSHSQIWALQQGDRFYLGGRSNRALVQFERDFDSLLHQL